MMYTYDDFAARHDQLGHKLGWRFLTCPIGNIQSASVALITLNPGGDTYIDPIWSVENGSAYVIGSWKNCEPGQEKLQIQVRRMFQLLRLNPEQVLSGYLVPFRSPDWKSLPNKEASIQFGMAVWTEVTQLSQLKLVIAFGKQIAGDVAGLLRARIERCLPAEWGDQTIDIYRFGDDRKLVVLPHLSRFTLFYRDPSERAFHLAVEG